MPKKNNLDKNITTVLVFTMITIFIWIGFDVYRILSKPSALMVAKEILEPVNPNFNQNSLEILRKRLTIDQKLLEQLPTPKELQNATAAAVIDYSTMSGKLKTKP